MLRYKSLLSKNWKLPTVCLCHIQTTAVFEYADDTDILGLISDNDDSSCLVEMKYCINCFDNNNLTFGAKKTKELIFYPRKCGPLYITVIIGVSPLECIEKFEYLHTIIEDKLS